VPPMPEPSRLDVTLARLKAMVGEERVGAPALEDTHRGGSFRVESFAREGLLPALAPKNGARMGHPPSARFTKINKRDASHPESEHPESEEKAEPARMALRRVRPPMPVRVELFYPLAPENGARRGRPAGDPGSETWGAQRPVAFRDAWNRFEIAAAYGPWRSSGCWWSGDQWDDEEWDVLARGSDGARIACLLVCDRMRNAWRLEAYYD
jgi:protein ImuB